MNNLPSPSPLNPQPAYPVGGGSRVPAFLPLRSGPGEGQYDPWVLAAAGLLAAGVMAFALCHLPRSRTLSWASVLFRSTGYVALTAAAGAAAIAVVWFFLSDRPIAGPTRLSSNMGVGWVFLPYIALLYWQRSPWMLVGVVLATLGMAFSLRRLFPVAAEAGPEGPDRLNGQSNAQPNAPPSLLPSLYGLPQADTRLSRAIWIALCAQASILLASLGFLLLAGVLFAIGLFLLVWRWSALDATAAQWWMGNRPPVPHATLAILMTAVALLPWVAGRIGGFLGRSEQLSNPSAIDRKTPEADSPSYGYVGIVLWPPPAKKQIIPPMPRPSSLEGGAAAKPLIIPFDGPYWYFKAPENKPGPRSRVARARATDVNVRSTDWAPLRMEAHQNLGMPIDLSHCSEIDVAITNADTRPGAIALALRLTDSTTPGKPSQEIGEQPIASSEIAQIPLARAPVKETLRFPIQRSAPRSATLRQFNQIAVVFRPSAQRARAGAKVSIDSFELVPRR